MTRTQVAAMTLVAVAAAGIGWFARELTSTAYISPAESISMAWRTQLEVLVDGSGATREPDQSARIAKITFEALSTGLALQYDQLPAEQRASLAPFIQRARVLEGSSDDVTLSVLGCLPIDSSAVDLACVQQAAARKAPGST